MACLETMGCGVVLLWSLLALAREGRALQRHDWAPRVPASDDKAVRSLLEEGGAPFVVTDALSVDACEAWCDALLASLGDTTVTRQRRGAEPAAMALGDFFLDALASSHEAPSFLFDEALLDGRGDLRDFVVAPQRAVFGGEESWLDLFPAARRPADACVVGAGAGARSPLHRDPYDWTGTSLCVEGSKVWRFVLDVDDDALDAYALASDAFGDSDSAGTQSDGDLYAERVGSAWPPPEAYADDETLAETWAAPDRFAPSPPVPAGSRLVTALQRAGDVVVVPPRSWHQTYALEPSLAVASQVCCRRDAKNVFAHVLHHAAPGRTRDDEARLLRAAETDDPAAAVRALFAYLR